jgi:hypothetical protein
MRTLYIIKPVIDASSPTMTCSYQDPENPTMVKMLTSDVDIVSYNHTTDRNPTPAVCISFGRDKQEHRLYHEPDSKDQYQMKMNNVIDEFYKKHPLFTINGKPHKYTKIAHYDISSDSDRISAGYSNWKNALEVAKMVSDMSDEKLRDACYFYGRSPKGLDRQMMVLLLADFNTGYAVKDNTPMGENSFIKMFEGESETERDFRIAMQKCLFYSIIENKVQGSRNNYYLGNEFIGTQENDVLAFLKREEKIYNSHILPKIAQNDELNHGMVSGADGPKPKKVTNKEFA